MTLPPSSFMARESPARYRGITGVGAVMIATIGVPKIAMKKILIINLGHCAATSRAPAINISKASVWVNQHSRESPMGSTKSTVNLHG
jgi:hypothetical protein